MFKDLKNNTKFFCLEIFKLKFFFFKCMLNTKNLELIKSIKLFDNRFVL